MFVRITAIIMFITFMNMISQTNKKKTSTDSIRRTLPHNTSAGKSKSRKRTFDLPLLCKVAPYLLGSIF